MEESKKLYLATFTLCTILYLEKEPTRRSMMLLVWATSEEDALNKIRVRYKGNEPYVSVEDIAAVEAID